MYLIKVASGIATRFTVSNNYCTTPYEQDLMNEGLFFKASLVYRGSGTVPVLLKEIEGRASIHAQFGDFLNML